MARAKKRKSGASKTEVERAFSLARRVVRRLCGAKVTLDIRLVPQRRIKGYYGVASKIRNSHYQIELADWMDRHLLFEYVVHETAHVVQWTWGKEGGTWDHGEGWGKAYAKVYRAMVGVR